MTAPKTPAEYKVGDTFGGFTVTRKESLEHLHGFYYELSHEKTGARSVHVACPDENNAFCVVFPTVPKDSTGVPHILEHVSLMGSKKYPVKDPFFSMIPRSLQTFINASTSEDHTNFLFSTRNEKDYYNLLSVYLDASFFPLLRETSFKQDGHRLEFEVPDDPTSGLRFKGVVFNEMKGYMATALFVSLEALGEALYPGITYEVNSGGDPERIPDLTWEQLKQFKATHYHPSNAFFVTYGNLPLEKTLSEIETVLASFEKITPDVSIPDVQRFTEPRHHRVPYPLSKDEDPKGKTVVVIGWVTTQSSNSYEILKLKVLSRYLLNNAASPLRKALIDSGLGEAVADFAGLSTSFKEAGFFAGLKGTDEERAEEIETIIVDTLKAEAERGVESEQIASALHQLEILDREVSNVGYPYAIKVVYTVAAPLTHGADPYPSLQLGKDVERLREEMKAEGFFEDLIRRYFLDNSHRARVIVFPDQEMEERQRETELARLEKIQAKLTEEDTQRLVEEAAELKAIQEARPDITVLPTLQLSDVPMTFEDLPHTIEEINGAKVGFFPLPTNGITYLDIRADFSTLPERLIDRLAVFAYALPRSGAADDDYVAIARRIAAHTGGVNASSGTRALASGAEDFSSYFQLSSKALVRNHEPFVAIMRDLMSAATFEPKRVKELIAEYKAQYDTFVSFAGTSFAISLASSKLKPDQKISERLQGLTLYRTLRDLADLKEHELVEVIDDLNAIRDHLFRGPNLQVCVTTDEKDIPGIKALLTTALGVLTKEKPEGSRTKATPDPLVHEARTLPLPVSYNAKVFNTVPFTHADSPALLVLAQYLTNKFLIRELREKRGAYGAFAHLGRENGLFFFATSQDPNLATTFDVLNEAVDHVLNDELDATDVTESILAACGELDPLRSPDMKGRSRFFDDIAGFTLELNEQYKKRLLGVTESDLKRVAGAYLKGVAAMASVTSPEKAEEANKETGGTFTVAPV